MTTEGNNNSIEPFVRNGISFNTLVVSPSETITSMQIICFFDFQKNQYYSGGTYAVNQHFGNELHEIRSKGIFRGNALETLLITPCLNQIPAHLLLLIGLGDPEKLSLDLLESVGYAITMEAIKLKVTDFCFAPSLKDAGITLSFGKTSVSKALGQGIVKALKASAVLVQKNLAQPILLTKINLLAGQPQAVYGHEGLRQAFGKED